MPSSSPAGCPGSQQARLTCCRTYSSNSFLAASTVRRSCSWAAICPGGKPGCLPPSPLSPAGCPTLSRGVWPTSPTPMSSPQPCTSSGEVQLGPVLPIQPERFCRDSSGGSRDAGAVGVWGSRGLSHLDLLSQLLPCEQASVPPGRGAPLAPVARAAALGVLGGRTQHVSHVGAQAASIIICV